ncbi:chromosomal replication initiator protein [Pilibacter termitis]|uniref:Chromosomal replication initiator protein DnaA n=1 Tax=Pilibacter termitis TaxID=263852 RepID=A0A1T4PX09_9ENTE|nr:chromosomal replication initiator protein DnaA [Pilibacter termitis]SJZ95771.1 chromosomal replication initiator protein [Pilibacter termitis]
METIDKLWDALSEYLQHTKKLSPVFIKNFVLTTRPISLENGVLTIVVPSDVHKEFWEGDLADDITVVGYHVTRKEIIAKVLTESEVNTEIPDVREEIAEFLPSAQEEFHAEDAKLNDRYTFENFVEGNSNKVAHAAALAVATKPGVTYNPLFIYGGSGLGKTHLMQAIGHEILSNNPLAKIRYITAENFTNEFVESIQKKKMSEFREYFRNLDLLMIDDVQFMPRESQTEVEFFHTFEQLINNGKAIVMTSDRLPKDLDNFTDRNVSRFQKGLIIDIAPADYETRLAILRNILKREKIEEVDDKILQLIASRITTQIRELEGAWTTVYTQATIRNKEITTDFVEEILATLNGDSYNSTKEMTILSIQTVVSEFYGLTVKDLKGKKRIKVVTTARQIAMYLSRELTKESLPKIGAEFGGKDHTTVMYASKNIEKRLKNDENFKKEVDKIQFALK